MKKTIAIVLLVLMTGVFAFGQSEAEGRRDLGGAAEAEMDDAARARVGNMLRRFFGERGRDGIGEVQLGDIRALAARASVLEQQARYVNKARFLSLAMPGLGHFGVDKPLEGVLFVAADLAVMAGSIIGVHFTLPTSVRFEEAGTTGINYFTAPFGQIETAWKALSFEDLLPASGIMAAGGLVSGLLRMWAASDAAGAARENIRSGAVEFEPKPFMFLERRLGLGFGLRY